jgi:hypothetical protein
LAGSRVQEQDAMQLCGCGIAQIYRSLAISDLGPENDVVLLIAEGVCVAFEEGIDHAIECHCLPLNWPLRRGLTSRIVINVAIVRAVGTKRRNGRGKRKE